MSKKTKKEGIVVGELSQIELEELAQVGTKEAMEKIEKYIKMEEDFEKCSYAEMMLEECETVYYQPKNEKEKEEFALCELIREKEENIDERELEAGGVRERVEKLMVEKKVHDKVLAKNKSKKEEWKYNWLQDFVTMEERKLEEIEENLEYEKAWVAEAKKMVTTERYKNNPTFLEHFNFNF